MTKKKNMTFKDVWGFEMLPMDDLFTEMFGRYAGHMYEYLGFGFSWEMNEYPEKYVDNENAKENKKEMIAGLIIDKFQLEDSPFYE